MHALHLQIKIEYSQSPFQGKLVNSVAIYSICNTSGQLLWASKTKAYLCEWEKTQKLFTTLTFKCHISIQKCQNLTLNVQCMCFFGQIALKEYIFQVGPANSHMLYLKSLV